MERWAFLEAAGAAAPAAPAAVLMDEPRIWPVGKRTVRIDTDGGMRDSGVDAVLARAAQR